MHFYYVYFIRHYSSDKHNAHSDEKQSATRAKDGTAANNEVAVVVGE